MDFTRRHPLIKENERLISCEAESIPKFQKATNNDGMSCDAGKDSKVPFEIGRWTILD